MSDFDLIVRSRRVLTSSGFRPAAVAIRGGRIAHVMAPEEAPKGREVLDAGDLVVMPGLVDTHVHVNEPGRAEWEGFDTATRAAAAGGVTTLVDMPLNSDPVTTTLGALELKREAARGRCWIDCGFWGGVVPGNAGELAAMAREGAAGFKAFLVHSGIDDFPAVAEDDLRRAMPVLARAGAPLLVHAELARSRARVDDKASRSYSHYLASRPAAWEDDAVALMARLCREHGCRVHIVHLSSAGALPILARAREEGLPITAETCPHYLTFSAEEIAEGRTEYKCAPPIRERDNRERLWAALGDGLIDMVVSDHSPCLPALKLAGEGDFMRAWGGIASLQFALPAVWTQARRRGFALEDVVRWMCERPARLAGLGSRKGAIAPGLDADLILFDPEAGFTVEPSGVLHRHRITPYAGRRLQGVIHTVLLHGKAVYEKSSFKGTPRGELLKRHA